MSATGSYARMYVVDVKDPYEVTRFTEIGDDDVTFSASSPNSGKTMQAFVSLSHIAAIDIEE